MHRAPKGACTSQSDLVCRLVKCTRFRPTPDGSRLVRTRVCLCECMFFVALTRPQLRLRPRSRPPTRTLLKKCHRSNVRTSRNQPIHPDTEICQLPTRHIYKKKSEGNQNRTDETRTEQNMTGHKGQDRTKEARRAKDQRKTKKQETKAKERDQETRNGRGGLLHIALSQILSHHTTMTL